MSVSRSSHVLIVAGEVHYQYLIYPMTTLPDHRTRDYDLPFNQDDDACQMVIRTGGAALVAQLLFAASPQWGFEVLGPVVQHRASAPDGLEHRASAVLDLGPELPSSGDRPYTASTAAAAAAAAATHTSLRVLRKRQIGQLPTWHAPPVDRACATKASTVIVIGCNEPGKHIEPALDFLERVKPRYIIHHMTTPLATGRLWDVIRNGPRTSDSVPTLDNLAVIINADDLRAEGISLSRSLSWEATAEDFVRNLGANGRLDTLVTCPNLIVRFGNEGVIHHRGRDATDPKLYFHTREVERDSSAKEASHMVGLTSAFTAGFALAFSDSSPPNNDKGIKLGIFAAREMDRKGFVVNSDDQTPQYPITDIADALRIDKKFSSVSIPSARISSGESWNIFDAVTGEPTELARQIVTNGPEKALSRCPAQIFGDLLSVERTEQESLRAVTDAVEERLTSSTAKPTSIGILGPPGAGKKFVATNLARHFGRSTRMKHLSYNARLLRLDDLTAICHAIRDSTASGALTIVVFENFEAILEPNNQLFNDFLVIMRDGLFTDRAHVHELGHPLLFFLVNKDGPVHDSASTPTSTEFKDRNATDETLLLDYLHGLVRIAGPNQTSQADKVFSVRRAIMLRHMLLSKYPHLESHGTIKIDDAVLHALLLVPTYKHGLRSLDKILSTSRLSNRTKFDVSALPPEEQIQLHVDGKIFMSFLRSPKLDRGLREKLAQGLFEAYKKQRRLMARTDAEKAELDTDPSMEDWDDLSLELKESTRAQADDIPRKLRAVGCFMLHQDRRAGDALLPVPAFSTAELDMLSEMEHERFNAERLQKQWRMGPRSSGKRVTPFLIPWRDLTQDWKDVDRVMVECVPRVAAVAGWKIYRMRAEEED